MTISIVELETATNNIFGNGESKIPVPEIAWQRKLDALDVAGLYKERAAAIFEMRCGQVEKMGFKKVTIAQMVEALMGEKYTHETEEGVRQTHEWQFNHHTGEIAEGVDQCWGAKPTDYVLKWRKNGWWLPPFNKVVKWTVRWGMLSSVKRQLPHEIALRLHDLKALKMFNAFNIIGPIESFEKDTDIKPVITAAIWEIPPMDCVKYNTSGTRANYFIGKW